MRAVCNSVYVMVTALYEFVSKSHRTMLITEVARISRVSR